ncbi:diacylglycerol kinase family protein [Patescibacteria group bacterium]|nr:diacylglycerol kinase family protein [Patescibacteria group bacterium]
MSQGSKKFSLVARVQSANHAVRGIGLLLKNTHNAWMHIFFGLLAIYLGYVLKISNTEWLFLVLTIGLVIVAEAINTAIEIDIDLTSPEEHPYARDSKDMGAGAVLLAVFMALIVGGIIFLPKILVIAGV